MKKKIRFTSLFLIMFVMNNTMAVALESLTPNEMKKVVAQAGVDIAIGNMVREDQFDNFRISNPNDSAQSISFNNIGIISKLDTGSKDMNDDGSINHLSLDVGLYDNKVMFFADSPDLNLSSDITVDDIVFCNTSIGSLFIDNFGISSFHFYAGAHAVSGIDFELGMRLKVDKFQYNYNSSSSLTLSGITFTRSFSSSSGTLEDPSTWVVEPGEFTIGNILSGSPASVDFSGDKTVSWNFTDSGGNSYSVANPRYNTGYIALNLPMEGSIRVENLNMGGNNLGSIAIDGIKVEKLYIEIPGRGLGNP